MTRTFSEGNRLISRKQLLGLLTVSDSTLWRLEQTENFPKKIYLGERRVAYFEDEILSWLRKRKEQ